MGQTREIRVGLVLKGGGERAYWHNELISLLSALPEVEIFPMECVVPEASRFRLWDRLVGSMHSLSDTLFIALPCGVKKIQPRLDCGLPKEATFDVVIDLSGQIETEWQRIGSLGLWRLFDGAGRPFASAFPGIESVTQGRNAEISLVQVQRNGAFLRRQARFAVGTGYTQSLRRQFEIAAQLIKQAVIDSTNGIDPAESCFIQVDAPLSRSRVLACLLQGAIRAVIARTTRVFFTEGWMVGVIATDIRELLSAPLPLKIRWLGKRETGRYFADPFGVPGSADRIYCEELDQRTNLGTIKELKIIGDALTVVADVSFSTPEHLSYPYLFSDNGQEYCLPEAAASRCCVLYAKDGAQGWKSFAILLDDVAASDPTIFRWQDRYWLAYTDDDYGPFDNLCLAYADQLSGPWLRHANNPVKRDLYSSRSAGTPFTVDGTLYRPAQNCGRSYGAGVAINRVVVCTPTAFCEELVRDVAPDNSGPNPDGFHTISAWGEYVLVDGKRHVFNPAVLVRKIMRRLTPHDGEQGQDCTVTPGSPTSQQAIHAMLSHITIVHGEFAKTALLERLCNGAKPTVLSFLNQHGLNLAWDTPQFLAALRGSDVLIRDGIGMSVGLRLIGLSPGLNLNGTDLIPAIAARFAQRRVMLLGTVEPYLGRAATVLQASGCNIVGTMDGFLDDDVYVDVARRARPELIILGMGMPKQERIALRLSAALDYPVLIVNGGAIFDFLSGRFPRAPAYIRHLRMEWCYRLVLEPKRMWRRYILGGSVFAARILRLRTSRQRDDTAVLETPPNLKE